MNAMKKVMALLLVFALAVSCLPLGAVTAFAAEMEDPQVPADDVLTPDATEEATEPVTEPTTETTEAQTEETEPATEPTTEGTEPIPEETVAEEEPVEETTEPTQSTEPEKGPLMKSAAPADTKGGSSGSETGDGGDGGGNAAGDGSSNMIAVGVTMQIVYYRYDECYNRYNSHGSVISTVQNGKAIPWNSTGKDKGETMTTVFDTYTITDNTFIVKARWDSYPYVYHFPTENLSSDGCTFTWSGFTNYWFNYDNPGGSAGTYPRIVRNEEGGSLAIENFLARIILGNDFGAWDKLDVAAGNTVATDSSLFAEVLKYLGASDQAIQNYLDSYYGKLSVIQNGDVLIPTIIWSYVAAENLGGTNRIYTIGDVASNGSSNKSWLSTAYTSPSNCNSGFGACSWKKSSSDTMICKLMLGGTHSSSHNSTIWKEKGSDKLFGTGLVNRIQTQVDATAENGTNTFYYLRGYWTPYGTGSGEVSLTKTNTAGTANLAGAEFTLYRDPACTTPVTSAEYYSLNTSDTGYVNVSTRKTDSNGKAKWTGLYTGAYFLKEVKAPDGYKVNIDASGNVEVTEVPVGKGSTPITLTNAENSKPVSLKKSINASQACIDQIKNNSLYSLAGAEYTISLNGKVVETLVTDASGNATSTKQYNIGDVLTIKETKAPKGYKLDTKTYTHTVTSGENLISVSDIPIFDPPFVLTKVDKDTTTPQGDGSFTGAVFKWEYFPNNNWSGTPARVWYFATDSAGRCVYSKDYLASGYTSDALYVSPANVQQLPLGTVRITEVKNSLGYTVIASPLYCTIAEDASKASGAKHVWTEESKATLTQMANGDWGVYEPIDINLFGSVSIEKYDAVTGQTAQGEATLAGAVYATPEEIAKAKEMDLLTYLRNYEPGELVKVANGTYCTREHDSLKISNGKWYWFSRKIGSSTALDYLIHVKGYSLPAAVETILGRSLEKPPASYKQPDRSSKILRLPPRNENPRKVTAYLRARGIHPAIIDFCYRNNLLYEGMPYNNAVFIGYDEKGTPRYAALRGTGSKYKGEATGSDKQYSFNVPAAKESTTLHLFEAAIDLLSYATMEYRAGRDWHKNHLLSLAGVFVTKREDVVPVALERYLKVHPEIDTIILHLDRDAIGRGAAQGIFNGLGKQYTIQDELPEYGNDMNDTLRYQIMMKEAHAR